MNTVVTLAMILAIVLVLAFVVLLSLKVRIHIKVALSNDGKFNFDLVYSLFGGRYSKRIDFKKKLSDSDEKNEDKSEKSSSEIKSQDEKTLIQKIKDYYNTFLKIKYTWLKSKHKIRKSIMISKLCLKAEFGLEDAAHTGMTTGVLWTAVYNIVAFVSNFASITQPDINITPLFEEERISADGECIIDFRLANIIVVFMALGINYYFINKKMTKKEKAAINYGKSD